MTTNAGSGNDTSVTFAYDDANRKTDEWQTAGFDACKRIKTNTVEKRLLNSRGEPNFNINFYALNAKGEFAGVAMYSEKSEFAVCTEDGPKTVASEALIQGKPEDKAL